MCRILSRVRRSARWQQKGGVTMRRQVGLGLIFALGLSGASWAIDPIDTDELVREVTAGKLRNHLEALQAIAAKNDNNRALGTSGYRRSVEYVMNNMVN